MLSVVFFNLNDSMILGNMVRMVFRRRSSPGDRMSIHTELLAQPEASSKHQGPAWLLEVFPK